MGRAYSAKTVLDPWFIASVELEEEEEEVEEEEGGSSHSYP